MRLNLGRYNRKAQSRFRHELALSVSISDPQAMEYRGSHEQ